MGSRAPAPPIALPTKTNDAVLNTLTICYPDKDRVRAAINNGAINGTIRGDDVEMAGGTALADYLAREGGKSLFPEESAETWQRAKVVPVK